MNAKLVPPLIATAVTSVLFLAAAGFDATGRNRLDPRNIRLANTLSACASYETVAGDVRVGYTPAGNIVFDVWACKDNARRVDPLHLLLQFGYKIKDTSIDHLSIASAGREVYRLAKTDLDELSREYDHEAVGWAILHWPERLRHPDGTKPFTSHSGGLLSELNHRIDDLNEALKAWLETSERSRSA